MRLRQPNTARRREEIAQEPANVSGRDAWQDKAPERVRRQQHQHDDHVRRHNERLAADRLAEAPVRSPLLERMTDRSKEPSVLSRRFGQKPDNAAARPDAPQGTPPKPKGPSFRP
jgi:hypothetical protein